MDLFQFASSDASLLYLGSIFGNMNNIIPSGGDVTILSTMFRVFNSTVLAVGALVVLYVTVMSVVMTAHEGEFMGKKWNNIWIFIRIVFAIALMIPGATGYCAIQFIMMWVIVQGIGAADVLWTTALNYVATEGGVYAQPEAPTVGVGNNLTGLFQALVCDQSAKWTQPDPLETEGGNYYCAANNAQYCGSAVPTFGTGKDQHVVSFGPNGGVGPNTHGACGKLTICDVHKTCNENRNGLACAVCTAQVGAINSTIGFMTTAARQFVQAEYQYRLFYANSATNQTGSWGFVNDYCRDNGIAPESCCVAPVTEAGQAQPNVTCQANDNFTSLPPNQDQNPQNISNAVVKSIILPYASGLGGEDFIATLTNRHYTQIINSTARDWGTRNGSATSDQTINRAQSFGWLMAGSFYYYIAQQNNAAQASVVPTLTFTPAADISTSSNPLYRFRNNFNAAGALTNATSAATANSPISNEGMSDSMGVMSSINSDMNNSFNQNLSPDSSLTSDLGVNPIAKLQHMGAILLQVVEIGFFVILALTFVAGTFGSSFEMWVLGNGWMNPIFSGLALAYTLLAPLMIAMFGLLIVYGGMLAIYTPLIPYVIYTVAAIGWFISVVEAMVAGPLVALGMLSPNTSGHEILGKSEKALEHLFSIFLRPSLMIFGLIAAMLVATAVIAMINAGFWNIRDQTGSKFDPLANILFFGAYIALVISALNKSYSLIYVLPNQVLTWIGFQGGQESAAEALGAVKGGQEQAGQFAAQGAAAGKGAMKGGIEGVEGRAAELDKKQTAGQLKGAIAGLPKGGMPKGTGGGGGKS